MSKTQPPSSLRRTFDNVGNTRALDDDELNGVSDTDLMSQNKVRILGRRIKPTTCAKPLIVVVVDFDGLWEALETGARRKATNTAYISIQRERGVLPDLLNHGLWT